MHLGSVNVMIISMRQLNSHAQRVMQIAGSAPEREPTTEHDVTQNDHRILHHVRLHVSLGICPVTK